MIRIPTTTTTDLRFRISVLPCLHIYIFTRALTTNMTPGDDHPSTRIKFARRFLRSLSKMRNTRPSSSSICVMKKRSERLKMAAYWCMARAVGSRRAWSRAVLMKLMKRRRMRSGKSRSTCLGNKINNNNKKKKKKKQKTTDDEDDEEGLMKRQTEKLREVVPGGKSMDICSLLEETAHFVTCLAAQVHVMQTIAHHYS